MPSRSTRNLTWAPDWTLFWWWFPPFLLFPGNWDVAIIRIWELAFSGP